jgi:hypothetical protein
VFTVRVVFDTSKPSNSIRSYKLSISETEDTAAPLAQDGPAWNGRVTYRGTFKTLSDAVRAASDHITALHTIVLRKRHTGAELETYYELCPLDGGKDGGKILARRSPSGTYIAA